MKKKCLKVEVFHSRSGVPYLACRLSGDELEDYADQLKSVLCNEYVEFERNRFHRDGVNYHITVLNPREYRDQLNKAQITLGTLEGAIIEFTLVGLGAVSDGDNWAYYVVAESNDADEIREALELPKRDFHVTLGFRESDVHGRSKDRRTLISTGHTESVK